jgi:hypothetical protein
MRLQHFSRSRWLIIAPALLATVWSFVSPVSAEPLPGLNTTYYTIDQIPPVKSDSVYPICGSEIENNINRSYDGEPYQDCTYDLFMVHMTGFITIPEHQTIEFWLASDDGGTISIGGNEWGNWSDQGCTWMESGQIDISAGSQPLDVWMYENGGGTCLMLAWNIDNLGWAMVPDEAFTTDYQQPVQTTIPETTIPDTTIPDTTMPETTTTWETTTTSTTVAPTTVPAINPSTTTTPQTTTSLSPTTTEEAIPASTTTLSPSTTEESSTTTTTEAPTPTSTLPPVSNETSSTSSTSSSTTTTSTTSTTTTTLPPPITTLPEPPQAPETSQPAKDAPLPPISDEAVVEALADIEQATPAQVQAIITELLAFDLTPDQAVSVASEPAVLEVLTNAEAEQVFEQVAVEELTTEQAAQFVEAIASAPTEVRQAFESVLNVFQGFADNYVMLNQTVPIKTRRALIALGAVFLVSAPAPIRRNR